MERGRPLVSNAMRAPSSNPTIMILPQAVSPSTSSAMRPSPSPIVVCNATPKAQPISMILRPDGQEQPLVGMAPVRPTLPDFSNGPQTSLSASMTASEDEASKALRKVLSSEDQLTDNSSSPRPIPSRQASGNTGTDPESSAGIMLHSDEDGGPVTLQQVRRLSEEQFTKLQRTFQEKVSQLHQVIDTRLQGVATRRMLEDHATLGMLNQLSAACEERFKMLETDWSLHGQKLLRVEQHCSSQEEVHSDLEQQLRRMNKRLSLSSNSQGSLGLLPSEEDLVGTLEAIQRDIDLLRSSQSVANGELMQHRAELMSMQGQSPEGSTVGGMSSQPTQPLCTNCGNVHLARAQFCRICGKKREDKISGVNTPTQPGAPNAPSGLVEDLDARLRGLEANMSAALSQRRNEAAEISVQVESVQDHVRLLEAHLQSFSADATDRKHCTPDTLNFSILDCSSEAQDHRRTAIMSSYATKHELLAVASGCKALEVSVEGQIAELRGNFEEFYGSMKQDVAKLEFQASSWKRQLSTSSDGTSHWHPMRDDIL
mmetsp:Transcript_114372/g.220247  ORF Transcript_114372/g.220247 Transcript_114372/m.220247 type:complete len:542 (+) Transcript_114372:130-1755(+)